MATTERGLLMPSQRQSLTILPMATQSTAMATTERGPLMPSQRQSPTMAMATQPMATATTERGPLMPSQRQSLTMPMATLLMVTMFMESKVQSAETDCNYQWISLRVSFHFISKISIQPFLQVTNYKDFKE